MGVALAKISVHIANPKKFVKASALLRQLFAEGKLSGAHGDLVFEVTFSTLSSLQVIISFLMPILLMHWEGGLLHTYFYPASAELHHLPCE